MNYSFLKFFGCEAYEYIDKEYMKKMDAKSQTYYFIIYDGF